MIISEISACKKSKDRCNVYVDGEFVCALFLDTILDFSLKAGAVIEQDLFEKIIYEDGCKKCFIKGCSLLSVRSRGEKELRQKLLEKGFSKEQVDVAMNMLIQRGYIDDISFAREYAEYLLKKGYGGFAIKQRLYQKGIDGETVCMVIEELDSDDNMAAALEYGKRAFAKALREDDTYKRKQKFIASMGRHGFGYEIAKNVYDRLVSEAD